MYNIDETTGIDKYLAAGIHQDLKITGIKAEGAKQDGTGSKVLRFYFENEDGATFNHTEFEIDPARLKELAKQWKQDGDALVKQNFQDQAARIKMILGTFLPADQIKINATGWEDYIKKVVALAGTAYESVKVRLKITLNSKDYTSLPKKALNSDPFIQNMDEENLVKLNPKYDRVVPKAPTEDNLYGGDEEEDEGLFEDDGEF